MPGVGSSINSVSPMIPPNSKSSCDVPLLESVWRILASVWPSGLVHSRSCGIQRSRKNNVTIRTTYATLKYRTGWPCVNPYAMIATHRNISPGQAMQEMGCLILDSMSEWPGFHAHFTTPCGSGLAIRYQQFLWSNFLSFRLTVVDSRMRGTLLQPVPMLA